MTSDLLAHVKTGRSVHLWQRRLDLDAAQSAADLAILSDAERHRASQFRRAPDRCRFVRRHGHLRTVLAGYLGMAAGDVPLDASLHRPPRLTGGGPALDLRLSLSGSADRSIVAIAWRRRVGVDIERITPHADGEAVAAQVFSPLERGALQGLPAERRRALFFRIWTRKEAFVKALGCGLSRDLMSFDVLAEGPSGAIGQAALVVDREATDAAPAWCVRDVAAPAGFAIACCAEGEGWATVFKEHDP